MKYIDVDLLLKEIEKKSHEEQGFSSEDSEYGYRSCARDLLAFITSLQQEQPEPTEGIKGNLEEIPSNVDLEKEMDKYYGMYRDKTGKTYDIKDGELCFDWKEDELSEHEMRMAKHFYELGLKVRKEE